MNNYSKACLIFIAFFTFGCSKFFGTDKGNQATNKSSERRATANNNVVSPAQLESAKGFPEFRDNLISQQNRRELSDFMETLKKEEYLPSSLNNKSMSYILAKESVMLVKVNRGIFYRMRNLVKKHNFSRAMVINALRMTAAGIDTFLPGNQWEAGFDYVTQPFYPRAGNRKFDISNDAAFKRYLVTEVDPALEHYLGVLDFLIKSKKANLGDIYWDNIIFNQNFTNDNPDRFTEIGLAELKALRASTLLARAAIQGVKAYKLTGFFATVDSLSKSFGFGAAFKSVKARAEKRHDILRGAIKDGFLSKADISDEEFREALKFAYEWTVKGVREANEAWKILEANPGYDNFFKADSVIPFARIINDSFRNIKIVAGQHTDSTILSVVSNGEQLSFNLKKYFLEHPIPLGDVKSFADFLPTAYDSGRANLTMNIDGARVSYRNYRSGNPTAWNSAPYEYYFGSSDVKRVNRVLAQSWGTAGFGLPLLIAIL